jgi:hypothetical protein
MKPALRISDKAMSNKAKDENEKDKIVLLPPSDF